MGKFTFDIRKEIICDTFVLGGGLAGTSAAIASARGGLDTVLCEAGGTLGGQAGIGLVTPMSSASDKNGKSFGGLVSEIVRKAELYTAKYGKNEEDRSNKTLGSISPQLTKLAFADMVHECGVKVLFYTTLAGVNTSENKIESVVLCDKSGFVLVRAKYYIDGSGDGDLVFKAGDDYVLGSEPGVYEQLAENDLDKVHESDSNIKYDESGLMQPVSLFFLMRGVDFAEAKKLNNKKLCFGDLGITRESFEKWEFCGSEGFELDPIHPEAIPTPQGRVLVTHGRHEDEAVVNMSRIIGIDGSDADSLSDGEMRAQRQLVAIVDFLKTFIPAFKNAYLTEASSRLGVRESRRLKGKYVLSGGELIKGKSFDDAVCRGYYIVDIHDPAGKNKAIGGEILKPYFEVPFGSLCSKNFANLLAAGRCVSCDHVAASAVRIQGTCILTGEAAGGACVTAFRRGELPCETSAAELREYLSANGVVL